MGCAARPFDGPPPRGARLLEPGDDEFPPMLADVEPPVRRLWAIGRDLRALPPMVAVVGTRRPTPYGREVASTLAYDLARAGVCVVSGMALGVDGAAHEGALRARGATVAVLGSGVDVCYPGEHSALYERIAVDGTIVAEVPPGAEPRKEHFPARNRIIAGLAHALVFVQGRAGRSGAMGTASRAHELDREVFAVPGDLRAAMSSGPHALLKEGWAHPCTEAADVLERIAGSIGWRTTGTRKVVIPPGLSPERRAVLEALADGPADADAIAARAGLDPQTVLRAIGGLELSGLIRRDLAGTFEPVTGRPP